MKTKAYVALYHLKALAQRIGRHWKKFQNIKGSVTFTFKVLSVYQVFHFQRTCICPSFSIGMQNTLKVSYLTGLRKLFACIKFNFPGYSMTLSKCAASHAEHLESFITHLNFAQIFACKTLSKYQTSIEIWPRGFFANIPLWKRFAWQNLRKE